jgi:hypothetical protein
MDHAIASMQPCIEACTECHHTCLQTAMTHCLQVGGSHTSSPDHFTLMLNCAEICQAVGQPAAQRLGVRAQAVRFVRRDLRGLRRQLRGRRRHGRMRGGLPQVR